MKTTLFAVLSLSLTLLPRETHADRDLIDSGETFRFPIWFAPSPVDRIHGLAIMPIASGFIYDKPQAVNGLALHGVGLGLVVPLVPMQYLDRYKAIRDNSEEEKILGGAAGKVLDRAMNRDWDRVVDSVAAGEFSPTAPFVSVNGGMFSVTGTISNKMNGVSVSLLSNDHGFLNGISACPGYSRTFHLNGVAIGAINDAFRVRGIQVGILNSTYYLSGIQLGIINRNRKRTTPLINWSMDK